MHTITHPSRLTSSEAHEQLPTDEVPIRPIWRVGPKTRCEIVLVALQLYDGQVKWLREQGETTAKIYPVFPSMGVLFTHEAFQGIRAFFVMTQDPYTKIHNDLLEALLRLDISGIQLRIILWVMRNSYGWNGAKFTEFTWYRVAHDINQIRSGVSKAGRKLLDRKILEMQGSKIGVSKRNILTIDSGGVPPGTGSPRNGFLEDRKWVPGVTHAYPYSKERKKGRETSTDGFKGHNGAFEGQRPPTDTTAGTYDKGFSAFWSKYPKKVKRPAAWAAWSSQLRDPETIERILAAVDLQKQSDQWKDPQYIPQPANWILNEQWNDAIELNKNASEDIYG